MNYCEFVQRGLSLQGMTQRKLSADAREFFRKKGKKGGKLSAAARLKKLTPEQRSEIAKKAAAARWGKKPKGE
jgi:hypothetical protein